MKENSIEIAEYNFDGNLLYDRDYSGYESWYEYDANGNCIHWWNSKGYEAWYEHDSKGNMIHSKDSDGHKVWWDSDGNIITKEEYDELYGTNA